MMGSLEIGNFWDQVPTVLSHSELGNSFIHGNFQGFGTHIEEKKEKHLIHDDNGALIPIERKHKW